jgi:hypothetical protein
MTATKKDFTEYLNDLGDDLGPNNLDDRWNENAKYGDWLKRNDPIAFNVAYSDWVSSRVHLRIGKEVQ